MCLRVFTASNSSVLLIDVAQAAMQSMRLMLTYMLRCVLDSVSVYCAAVTQGSWKCNNQCNMFASPAYWTAAACVNNTNIQ